MKEILLAWCIEYIARMDISDFYVLFRAANISLNINLENMQHHRFFFNQIVDNRIEPAGTYLTQPTQAQDIEKKIKRKLAGFTIKVNLSQYFFFTKIKCNDSESSCGIHTREKLNKQILKIFNVNQDISNNVCKNGNNRPSQKCYIFGTNQYISIKI